ncbi:MAG TPA: hypothetical protein VHO25_00300 [Polyangiaceae bacterium]|nr:hypothetical protein [Polyangiaceae bacterium]
MLAPLTARAGDPAAAPKVPPPAPEAPLTDAPAGTGATAPAEPVTSAETAPAAAPAAPPTTAAPAVSTPAPAPSGWEGESAKDRMSASMYPHETEKVTVDLRGDEGDTFYAWLGDGRATSNATVQIGGEVFEQLCDAPCSAQLPTGRNRIAVARGGSPVVANQDVTLYAPTTLTAKYSSYAAQRIIGTLLLVGGSVGALTLILTAPECEKDPSNVQEPEKCNNTQEYIGFGVGVAGVVAGSLLLIKGDDVEVAIAPGVRGSAPAPTGSRGYEAKDRLADALKGFQLSVRF